MIKFYPGCLGFGRMGPNRELKFALEKHWKGELDAEGLLSIANKVENLSWDLQQEAGLEKITVGDFCLYDNVLQWSEWLGIIPSRFAGMSSGMSRMFAMARGVDGAPALSMKKWLNSNYHYMVPEVDESFSRLSPDFSLYLKAVDRGIAYLGVNKATPVLIGPVSLVHFCTFKTTAALSVQRFALLDKLLPIYSELIGKLVAMGVREIQIHEPSLVFADTSLFPLFKQTYPAILSLIGDASINMVSFFDDMGGDNYQWLIALKEIKTITLDFTRGETLKLIQKFGFPKDKVLGAGLVDGRSVWKMDPEVILPILEEISSIGCNVCIQPSSSLQFVPWTLSCEAELLQHTVGNVLAFGKEKLSEVVALCRHASGESTAFIEGATDAWRKYRAALSSDQMISKFVASLKPSDFVRSEPYSVRRPKQLEGLPLLPTTSIGSFPQTKEIRSLRNQYKRGKITKTDYEGAIDQQIAFMIGVQEGLGLDILVHGEPERTDMVEFFAQQMNGMLFSRNGWVQSFGSRCVRPPIIWNDISRQKAMTVREFEVAQRLTTKPVKGMLTGPVTILNWSFPRADKSRKEQAMQIAIALREEIADLESAGCKVIQVDEPALREAMPLRTAKKEEYLTWAIDAFRLATAGAKSETQIHTHMCYCEFADCMEAIDRLDTDFNSIENARSDNATLLAFKKIGYRKGLGPGTYDIHSPVVPPPSFIEGKLKSFLQCMDKENLVVNPDCGLKTRDWPETIAALKVMVEATRKIREGLQK